MQHLQNWFQANSLKMNPDKTDFILFGTKFSLAKAAEFSIKISRSTITPSPTVKVLGVLLDQHLSWDSQVSIVVRRCNAIIASLYKIRHHLTPDVLKLLVHTHVFPHISYCLSAWGGASRSRLDRVQRCLNFAARLVTGTRRSDHISPVLESLQWERVETLVARHDTTIVHKCITSEQCPEALRDMFQQRSAVSARRTRATDAGLLHLPKCRLSQTQRCFSYRAALTWNALPPALKAITARREFVKAMSEMRL